MPKMDIFLYDNHWGSSTLTLLNVLIDLNGLNVLNVPKDPSLACWALFFALFGLTNVRLSKYLEQPV